MVKDESIDVHFIPYGIFYKKKKRIFLLCYAIMVKSADAFSISSLFINIKSFQLYNNIIYSLKSKHLSQY